MPCPKVLAAGTGTTPYPHTKTPNINTTHNQAKPLGRHHLPVHWQRPTAASRQPSKRTGWSAHVSSSVRHTLPTCQSRRASVLLDHEDHGLDGGDRAVISSSRWAGQPAEQQQQEQLPLRMDASRDTTPHQLDPCHEPQKGRSAAQMHGWHTASTRVCHQAPSG